MIVTMYMDLPKEGKYGSYFNATTHPGAPYEHMLRVKFDVEIPDEKPYSWEVEAKATKAEEAAK